MGDIYKIDISQLKSYQNDFNCDSRNFTDTYIAFSSSYLKKCNDYYVGMMANELEIFYSKIQKSYQNIYRWWREYNKNAENLENVLSENANSGSITESVIKSSINSLPTLENYNVDFTGTFILSK